MENKPKCYGKYDIDCYVASKEGRKCKVDSECFKVTPKESIVG